MRRRGVCLVALVLIGGVALLAADEPKPGKPGFRLLVMRLQAWIDRQAESGSLAEADAKEVREIHDGLAKLTAKELYDGLEEAEREKLLELIRADERRSQYADQVARIVDDVGLDLDDGEKLLDLYATYREAQRDAWRDRDKAKEVQETFERDVEKAFGRGKARAILNAIRKTPRWPGGGGGRR